MPVMPAPTCWSRPIRPPFIDLAAKGIFVPFQPDGVDKVPEPFRDPAGHYVAQRVSLISIYGRTDLIPAADMPKTWDDLLNPKYKGKLVMTNPSFTSLQLGVVAMMSKMRGWDYFERLNKNDVAGRSGQRAGAQSGEDRRAANRSWRRQPICQRSAHRWPQDPEFLPGRGHICHSGDDVGGQRQQESERRQAARRIYC